VVGTAIIILVLAALAFKLILPTRKLLIPGRAVVFLVATLALDRPAGQRRAQGSLGRSRPIDITQLGGTERYVRWWDPRGECPNNCSFVSGDVAGAFWTIAPRPWHRRNGACWPMVRAGAGHGMAALRVMAGAHFLSDVIFAGVFTFLIIWLAHGLIYRWPRTRLSDAHIEQAIQRIAMPGYLALCSLFCKKKSGGGKSE